MPEAVLTIESIAAGGDGVTRDEGLVVFVPRSAPADRALVSYVKRGGFARGRLRRLEQPSPDRVAPSCSHYEADRCGGCQLQHLDYPAQLLAKERIVSDALERIARRGKVPLKMHPSPHPWRYRRKLTLALQRNGGEWIAGLHPYDNPTRVFNLRECPITQDDVLNTWRDVMRNAQFFPHEKSLRASVLMIDGDAHFSLEGGTHWTMAGDLARACPTLASVWWTSRDGIRRQLFARPNAPTTGASFAQVNETVAGELRSHTLALAMRHNASTAIDAYSGAGELTMALAATGTKVTAIESDEVAVQSFSTRLPSGSQGINGLVENEIAALLPADLVIVNPPRSGLHVDVTAALAREGAVLRGIIYVSCNPATLARDIARLPGFSIKSLECFDMFPQTAHVETVCELVPDSAT
jgi:23S rRNA (uracil1939-C5)-methyltransferase